MPLEMFFLGPSIHTDSSFTHTNYLNIVGDHVHNLINIYMYIFPDSSDLIQHEPQSKSGLGMV